MKKILIATLALTLVVTSGRLAAQASAPQVPVQAVEQAAALALQAKGLRGVEAAKKYAQAAEIMANAGAAAMAAGYANSAMHAIDRSAANADPAGAAGVAASMTALVARPEVAKADPVTAAIVVTQATYVVNLPAVANIVATNPTVAASVAAVNNNTATVVNNADVKAAPANANITADIAKATDIGKANAGIVVTPVTPHNNVPPVDVSVVSKSS